jgi:hypothetical protein
MSTFTFSSASISSLSASKIYYAQMVTSAPLISANTVSDLSSILISTPQVLTGVSYTSQIFTFIDQIFNTRTYTSAHVGFVLVERVGASFSNSDPLIAFVPHTNTLGQEIPKPVGTYAINFDFAATGLFSVINAWQYDSGAYVNSEPIPKGLIYLIGSANNTTSFSNPAISPSNKILFTSGAGSFDRNTNIDNAAIVGTYGIDFINKRLRVGDMGILTNNPCSSIVTISGSNQNISIPLLSALSYDNYWTEIGSVSSLPSNVWSFISSSSNVFWRYLRVKSNGNLNPFEIEFYNSSVISPTQNIT